MNIFLILGTSLGIALLSLLGVLIFGKSGRLTGTHRFIVPFAIGAFLAVAFFELIPETLEASAAYGPIAIVGGFFLFYLLSNVLHTYHHHHDDHGHEDTCSDTKVTAMILLLGDAVHNFTDGVVIATAFFVNPAVGFVTALGVALHEIPQEIAEYGVLRHAGYAPQKAALLNFASALGVVVGAGATILFATYFTPYLWVLMGVAAGNLLYVATSDLLPGVHQESRKSGAFLASFIATLAGVVVVASLITYSHNTFGHGHEHESAHEVEHDEHDVGHDDHDEDHEVHHEEDEHEDRAH
ncbi:MAG: zinc and cadmium transporter [Patiriisocius sp.]|jgi:zinc and cadmium transporter